MDHHLFGQLEFDENEGYKTIKIFRYLDSEMKVELIIPKTSGTDEIEKEYCEAYAALFLYWDKIA